MEPEPDYSYIKRLRASAERNALMLKAYEGERLSFAQLAERFGVSRQRAQQIVARERAARRRP